MWIWSSETKNLREDKDYMDIVQGLSVRITWSLYAKGQKTNFWRDKDISDESFDDRVATRITLTSEVKYRYIVRSYSHCKEEGNKLGVDTNNITWRYDRS